MLTVHLVDDDRSVRTALERLLRAAGYEVLTYASADDYLRGAPHDAPGCLLLDLRLPGASGLELQAALRGHPGHEHPIVFLSGAADVPSSVQAMRAGACEFLTKPVDDERLLAAVQDAVARDSARRERRARVRLARQHLASLGERERQVLAGITAGRLHKQMAADLGVSERTIKSDRARVMGRMGVRTLPALLRLLAESGETHAADPPASTGRSAP
jgi:FixJ family two-component response regulator